MITTSVTSISSICRALLWRLYRHPTTNGQNIATACVFYAYFILALLAIRCIIELGRTDEHEANDDAQSDGSRDARSGRAFESERSEQDRNYSTGTATISACGCEAV